MHERTAIQHQRHITSSSSSRSSPTRTAMMTRLSKAITCLTRRHKSASDHQQERVSVSLDNEADQSRGDADGEMKACLSTLDLVSLGVGSCLGTGMYLTAGLVASTMAGPGGMLPFLMAGAASMLTGLCYAELAGRCPKTSGSAYMYAYVTVGELVAFIIGWGLVVEYVIGTAAGAVALSETLDSLSGGVVTSYVKPAAKTLGVPKVDVVAAAICVVLTFLLASGAEMSAKVNNCLNVTNIAVLVFFVIASLVLGSSRNLVAGGFFPYGLKGIVRAIPTCYFAYIGFDTVAATGAEAQNPSHSVPRSIIISIFINCFAYVIVILTLTFDLPFYLLPHDTAMTDVFPLLNFVPGKYIVAAGAVTGLFAATFGSMFPLPRVLTSMAEDGLIFTQLGKICSKRHAPVRATLLSGLVAMVMAAFIKLDLLIELVLIGTLLAYVLVTFAVLFVRYMPDQYCADLASEASETSSTEETVFEAPSSPRGGRSQSHTMASMLKRSSAHQEQPSSSPRRQPNMGRSEVSSSSKRVTFGEARFKHPESAVYTERGTKTHFPKISQNGRRKGATRASGEDTALLEASREDTDRFSDRGYRENHEDMDLGLCKLKCAEGDGAENHTKKASDLCDMLNDSRQGSYLKSHAPLWLQYVFDNADTFSGSPRGLIFLLCAVYGVELLICILLSTTWQLMADGNIISLGMLGVLSAIFMVLVGIVIFLPQSQEQDSFRAPMVPVLPIMVAFINIYLMTSLSPVTWLLFCIWMCLGMVVYLGYGVSHSKAGIQDPAYMPMYDVAHPYAELPHSTQPYSTHVSMLVSHESEDSDSEDENKTAESIPLLTKE